MTRREILTFVVQHARSNGFNFRQWFASSEGSTWTGFDEAIESLARGRRYYALLFSHEFAECFWKAGTQVSFIVPAVSYTVRDKQGKVVTIHRKPFTRRTLKANFWHYHLREMADSAHPLRYIRRFIIVQEDLAAGSAAGSGEQQADPNSPSSHPPSSHPGQADRPAMPTREKERQAGPTRLQ